MKESTMNWCFYRRLLLFSNVWNCGIYHNPIFEFLKTTIMYLKNDSNNLGGFVPNFNNHSTVEGIPWKPFSYTKITTTIRRWLTKIHAHIKATSKVHGKTPKFYFSLHEIWKNNHLKTIYIYIYIYMLLNSLFSKNNFPNFHKEKNIFGEIFTTFQHTF